MAKYELCDRKATHIVWLSTVNSIIIRVLESDVCILDKNNALFAVRFPQDRHFIITSLLTHCVFCTLLAPAR